jgi:hypothetical protein
VAEYVPKFPLVSGDTQSPVIGFDDAAWQRIESACQWCLESSVRLDIVRTTKAFLLFDSLERSAPAAAATRVILEAYDKAASRFFYTVFTDPSGSSDAGIYAHDLIELNFERSRSEKEAALFDALSNLLRAFHIFCNMSLRQLNEQLTTSPGSGNAWQAWVSRLSEIVDKAELSSMVRRDVGGEGQRGAQSPFTLFVWELQKCLPERCRRSTPSEAALADAITQARSTAQTSRRQ